MDFLVEFEVRIPDGTPQTEVDDRERAEASAAAALVADGHLVRLWRRGEGSAEPTVLGLYRADSEDELAGLLAALPLAEWMRVTVTPLQPHPNDPGTGPTCDVGAERTLPDGGAVLPDPRLTFVYRLEAAVAQPLELGDTVNGRRRIVPLTEGTLAGPELNGRRVPGASADWQLVLADGTAIGDVRYTLQTDDGDVLYVQSRGVRHGPPDVLARLARGDDVDAREYTFRTSTHIETAAPDLDWLNKGVFISVGGRRAGGVVYETYLVH